MEKKGFGHCVGLGFESGILEHGTKIKLGHRENMSSLSGCEDRDLLLRKKVLHICSAQIINTCSMNFCTCTCLWNHQPAQDVEHFQHQHSSSLCYTFPEETSGMTAGTGKDAWVLSAMLPYQYILNHINWSVLQCWDVH